MSDEDTARDLARRALEARRNLQDQTDADAPSEVDPIVELLANRAEHKRQQNLALIELLHPSEKEEK